MYKAYNIPGNQTQIVKTISTIHSVPHPREEKTATGGKNKASLKYRYLFHFYFSLMMKHHC